MPNYPGRRKGTRRIVIWSEGKPLEWVFEGKLLGGELVCQTDGCGARYSTLGQLAVVEEGGKG